MNTIRRVKTAFLAENNLSSLHKPSTNRYTLTISLIGLQNHGPLARILSRFQIWSDTLSYVFFPYTRYKYIPILVSRKLYNKRIWHTRNIHVFLIRNHSSLFFFLFCVHHVSSFCSCCFFYLFYCFIATDDKGSSNVQNVAVCIVVRVFLFTSACICQALYSVECRILQLVSPFCNAREKSSPACFG